jgi:transcription antitermination factor NusG
MESATAVPHDRVKILSGAFCGLLGRVVELTADEADVHLLSQDLVG